jgi:membrane associated rhomboid family serine protease
MEGFNTTIILVLVTCVTSYRAEENDAFKRKWIHNAYLVNHRQEYYRWLTSGFIHSGYMHLAFNMITLYSFGRVMEQAILTPLLGSNQLAGAVFLGFYLLAIIASDLPSYFKYKNNHLYNSLGASGGVSAVVMAVILFFPGLPLNLLFIPIDIPGFMFALLYLFYSAYMAQNAGDHINHNAHLFGSLVGIVFAIAIYPPVIFRFIEELGKFLWG